MTIRDEIDQIKRCFLRQFVRRLGNIFRRSSNLTDTLGTTNTQQKLLVPELPEKDAQKRTLEHHPQKAVYIVYITPTTPTQAYTVDDGCRIGSIPCTDSSI